MKRNPFEINAGCRSVSMPCRLLVVLFMLFLGAVAGRAQTQQQVVFQITDQVIETGATLSGSSQSLLPPAFAYSYSISGSCYATGNLAAVITGTVPISQALDALSSGTTAASDLQGTIVNSSGTLPFTVFNKVESGGDAFGTGTADFLVLVDGSGRASFLVDDISFTGLLASSTLVIVSATVTTTAVLSPVVVTGSASIVTSTSANLNGSVNPNGDSATVIFKYGLTSSYGMTTTGTIPLGIGATPVTASISGLVSGITYHFQVTGSNSTGETSGSDQTFETLPAVMAPTATTGTATNVLSTTATLTGSVNPNGADTMITFNYGLTGTYGMTTVSRDIGSGILPVPLSQGITNLAPGTLYHFQVTGSNSLGAVSGSDQTFTTAPAAAAPTVTTGSATNVLSTSATLNGVVNPNGAATTVTFNYGTTKSYGMSASQNIGTGTLAVAVNLGVISLTPGTLYHFQVTGSNSQGVTTGSDQTFMTPAVTAAPTATTGTASGVGTTTATLNGSVNPNGSDTKVSFNYGLTEGYGMTTASQDIGSGTSAAPVSQGVVGLDPGMLYHFRVTGSNSQGVTTGSDQTFTTAALPPTVATGSATGIGMTSGTLNGTVNPNGIAASAFFEYGVSSTNYTATTSSVSVGSGTTAVAINAGLAGLLNGTTYHFRAVGVSTSGTTFGADQSFTTEFLLSAFAGKYEAALSGSTNATSGMATITVSKRGSFTASVELAGVSVRFSGKFAINGSASATASGFTLNLQLGDPNADNTVTATLTGPVQLNFIAQELLTTKGSPLLYTVRLPHPADTSLPQGNGYGAMKVGKTGAIHVAGKLGDGTSYSASAGRLANGTWALYAPLYGKQGCIVGTITVETTANGDMDGLVTWIKPATSGSYTPEGFTIQVNLYGSAYAKPAAGQPVITSTSGTFDVEFNAGNLMAPPLDNVATLTSANKITFPTPPADGLKMTIKTSNGLFSGSFKDPTTNALRIFHGALFQGGLNIGTGVFEGGTEAGSVDFFEP